MHRSAGIALVSALIVASCAGAPSPSPTPSVTAPTVAPSASASPTPISTPISSPSLAPSATATRSDPPPTPTASARPTAANFFGLANARLDVPVHRGSYYKACAQGPRTKFVKGRSGKITTIEAAEEVDVDHDGGVDVVAAIDCLPGEGSVRKLVAFHRDADGTFTTIGLVVQAGGNGDENSIERVFGWQSTSTGALRVEVGDNNTLASEATGYAMGVHQIRTYDWTGAKFHQIAGSTTFVVPPGTIDLSLESSPMTYAKPVSGKRVGTLTVTIRNDGPDPVGDLSVVLAMEGGPRAATCAKPAGSSKIACPIARLAPGATKTVTFRQTISSSDPRQSVIEDAFLEVLVGDQRYGDVQNGVALVYK